MSVPFKSWFLGVLVSMNGMLAGTLAYCWIYIHQVSIHPLNPVIPVGKMEERARLCLFAIAATAPLGLVFQKLAGRPLPSLVRNLNAVLIWAAAILAIAFPIWKHWR